MLQQNPSAIRSRRASTRLRALGEHERGSAGISLGDAVDGLGQAGIGLTLLFLTLPALIPMPGPAGVVIGSAIAFVSIQIMLGAKRLWLPEILRRRRITSAALRVLAGKGARTLAWLEKWLKPRRYLPLTGRLARVALAFPLLVMAVTIILPIPTGNVLPAASLIAIALGFVERDGLAVVIGIGLSAAALVWTWLLLYYGAQILDWLTKAVSWI